MLITRAVSLNECKTIISTILCAFTFKIHVHAVWTSLDWRGLIAPRFENGLYFHYFWLCLIGSGMGVDYSQYCIFSGKFCAACLPFLYCIFTPWVCDHCHHSLHFLKCFTCIPTLPGLKPTVCSHFASLSKAHFTPHVYRNVDDS